jgi:hypothetical protein
MGFFNLIVYRYLKTFIIMTNFFLTFTDFLWKQQKATIEKTEMDGEQFIQICFYQDSVECENLMHSFNLDKSTAIKFAKTLRTEINKITESEVNNG